MWQRARRLVMEIGHQAKLAFAPESFDVAALIDLLGGVNNAIGFIPDIRVQVADQGDRPGPGWGGALPQGDRGQATAGRSEDRGDPERSNHPGRDLTAALGARGAQQPDLRGGAGRLHHVRRRRWHDVRAVERVSRRLPRHLQPAGSRAADRDRQHRLPAPQPLPDRRRHPGHQASGRRHAAIAGTLEQAAGNVEERNPSPSMWLRPGFIGFTQQGPYDAWKSLLDRVPWLLHDTAGEVRAAGEHLVLAMNLLDNADAASQEALDKHARDVADIARGGPTAALDPRAAQRTPTLIAKRHARQQSVLCSSHPQKDAALRRPVAPPGGMSRTCARRRHASALRRRSPGCPHLDHSCRARAGRLDRIRPCRRRCRRVGVRPRHPDHRRGVPADVRRQERLDLVPAGDQAATVRLPDGRTLWLFADTIQGPRDAGRQVRRRLADGAQLVRAPGPRLPARRHRAERRRGHPRTRHGSTFYWPQSGVITGGRLVVFSLRVKRTGTGPLDFVAVGTDAAVFSLPTSRAARAQAAARRPHPGQQHPREPARLGPGRGRGRRLPVRVRQRQGHRPPRVRKGGAPGSRAGRRAAHPERVAVLGR